MSSHLPECDCYGRNHGECALCNGECVLCICDRLRACEERVREKADGDLRGWIDAGYAEGRAAALDAARESVAGVLHWSEGELGLICNWNSVCDAIDALREEKK